MERMLNQANILPMPIRLHEFVAIEEGYFEAEGLQADFEWDAYRDLMGWWPEYKDRPQDHIFDEQGNNQISSACQWGSINNASSGIGKWVTDAYEVSRHAIFVRPESEIRRPEDLADVEIAVGWLAGSHFNTYLRLEELLPLERIKPIPVGGYGRRLEALMNGEVEAASLIDPQIFMADELGLRKVIAGTFESLWWVDEAVDGETLRRYFVALDKAERALQADLPKYLPLWERCIPVGFKDREWDVNHWGQGTHFVHAPYSHDKYLTTMAQIERWGLDTHMKTKDFSATSLSCH